MNYDLLRQRLGDELLNKRLNKQRAHSALKFRDGVKFYWENFEAMAAVLQALLKLTRLMELGLSNARAIEVRRNTIRSSSIPVDFDGYTILHLSDLHIDGMSDHGRHLTELVSSLDYDLCVISGDFRYLTYGQWDECVALTRHLVRHLKADIPVLGILGNHDFVEMIPELENAGVRILCNETHILRRGESSIGILGTDDVHFYESGDIETSFPRVAECPFKIALVHSQELIFEAERLGFDLYLCGHTHGGQVCLPGSVPLLHNTPRPFHRRQFRGSWRHGRMSGYTSRGTGSSGLPVRFFCPPELTLHTLSRA